MKKLFSQRHIFLRLLNEKKIFTKRLVWRNRFQVSITNVSSLVTEWNNWKQVTCFTKESLSTQSALSHFLHQLGVCLLFAPPGRHVAHARQTTHSRNFVLPDCRHQILEEKCPWLSLLSRLYISCRQAPLIGIAAAWARGKAARVPAGVLRALTGALEAALRAASPEKK